MILIELRMLLLTVLVLQILCIPPGRVHGRTCRCKGDLLKVREEKYTGKYDGVHVEAERACFCSSGAFKT
jgi:hypothetical protein